MPLKAEHELIGARIDHGFDHSVGGPGYGSEVAANKID
jgi:hypothetical protein